MKVRFSRTTDEVGGLISVFNSGTRLGTIRKGFTVEPWAYEDISSSMRLTGNNRVSVQRQVSAYYKED